MGYEYRDHEIYARVYQSMSTLYEVDSEGEMTEEVDGCEIIHDDQEIVWYEVEAVDPESGVTTQFCYLNDIDEARKIVDESIEYLHEIHPEHYDD